LVAREQNRLRHELYDRKNMWFTLQGGRLSEVYYPRLDTPSVRNLDFVVTDGQSFVTRAQDASSSTRLVNPESLTYQIVNTDTDDRWRLTTTYVTDSSRTTPLIDVEFTSLNGQPYQLYAVYPPQLNNPPLNAPLSESGVSQGGALLAADAQMQVASALVASPTMPWAFGTGLDSPSDAYHLVWSRDLYEMVTALIADGDLAGAGRALDFLFNVQQKPDGSFPQNSKVDGTPVWGGLQLDEVGDPIILAYQLGRKDAATWSHVKRAADFLVNFMTTDTFGTHNAPYTPGERWENQSGYSPSSTASEIAGLVCAADTVRRPRVPPGA
jgi:GH15 family glucan-1,4-alpha-glucosidase